MAMTKQDSVFKNISLPGGISTKATEFKELAAKGDKWESPVFGIGSARESSDIPKLTPVSRKPHSTAQGVVRGGNHPTSGQTTGGEGYSSPNGTSNYGPTSYGQAGEGVGSTNTSSGFSNQVDQAFDTKGNPVGASPTANGQNGSTSIYDNVTQR